MMTERHSRDARWELVFGGDWAIAHGDAEGLAQVANDLGPHVNRTLAERLRQIARLCLADYGLAAARWLSLREELREALRPGVVATTP